MAETQPHWAVYDGVVTNRVDELRCGRVQVRIPGLINEPGVWAWPIGNPGGGSGGRGLFWVPEVGADVAVFFKQGDPERPRYLGGMWGLPDGEQEIPEAARGLSKEDTPEVKALDFKYFEIVVDEREHAEEGDGLPSLRIRDKRPQEGADPNQDVIEYDGEKRGWIISSTVGTLIKSAGAINIEALQVRINKRIVRDTGDPI